MMVSEVNEISGIAYLASHPFQHRLRTLAAFLDHFRTYFAPLWPVSARAVAVVWGSSLRSPVGWEQNPPPVGAEDPLPIASALHDVGSDLWFLLPTVWFSSRAASTGDTVVNHTGCAHE